MQKKLMIFITLLFCQSGLTALATPTIVKVGSELIDGTRLAPFSAHWDQYSTMEGKRVLSATYHETLEVVSVNGDSQLKHIQIVKDQSGTQVTNTTYFDRASLKPLVLEQKMQGVPEGSPDNRKFVFTDTQYEISVTLPDGKEHNRTVHLPVDMFNVSNLGLVFAAMPLKLGETYRMPSAFPQYQDGMYWMDATVSGEKTFINDKGEDVSAWQVDIRWINIKGGDEYPAGPTQSGGAYFIAKKGAKGIAPVPAYINDTIAIEVSHKK